jgi:predicted flap endonuclease-1-like 5' DNA nuclease
MNLLFRIVYAAHANGTHHKLALDALRYLENPQAEAWRRLFLSEAEAYLEASKIPDKEFKDFKNHVLHVGDDFWGGAPEKVESWYKMLVRALEDGTWSEAVWAAGIISHYYTDPIHPFHTAQSPAENEIHRAVEWSISKSYDDLWRTAARLEAPMNTIGTEPAAIKDHVIAGAEFSNRYYETLIAHYDFARGVVEPTEGLDAVSRALVCELLRYAAVGTARLIDRALAEAGAEPPKVALTAKTVIAGLKIPAKWVTRKLEDAADRRQVEAMFDELSETGRVEATLPEDDRQVRDLHEAEVMAPRRRMAAENRARRRRDNPLPQGQIPRLKSAAGKNGIAAEPLASLRRRLQAVKEPLAAKSDNAAPSDATRPPPASTVPETGPRTYLAAQDDVERAPSIGPKTAARLYALDIKTVDDLLAADPADIARGLGDSRIDEATVAAWQQQSRLVVEIPGLRGGQAQLLVGGGLTTVAAIAETEPADAMAAILQFANTHDGRRVLRDAPPPDLEKVHTWVQRARAVNAAA